MMSSFGISRRKLLFGAGLVSFCAVGAPAYWFLFRRRHSSLHVFLKKQSQKKQPALHLLNLYLEQFPQEKKTSVLLESAFPEYGQDYSSYPSSIGELVRAKIDKDFAEEDIVMLEGWYLSRTEMQVFALVRKFQRGEM